MTRFSVLIPVYNVEKTLNRCVDSVLQQTFSDYEIVLIDDGSSDKSGIMCDKYAETYPNIRVHHQENHGLLLTRIKALRLSNGQFCIFLDSDDWLHSQALERIDEVIVKNDCDVVMYNYRCVSDTAEWLAEPVFKDNTIFTENNKKDLLSEFFQRDSINSVWSKAVKRDVFFDVPDFGYLPQRVSMGEDVLVSIHVYRRFSKLVYINEPLVFYYINKKGITRAAKSHIYYRECNIVFKEKYQFIDEMGLKSTEVLSRFAEQYMITIANYLIKMNQSKLKYKNELIVYRNMRKAPIFELLLLSLRTNEHSARFTHELKYAVSLLIKEKYNCLYAYIRLLDYYYFIRSNLAKLIRRKG